MSTRWISLAMVLCAVPEVLHSQGQKPPLTIQQVELLIRDLPDRRLATEVRSRGIRRPFRAVDLERLRYAGAGNETQEALSSYLIRSSLSVFVNPVVSGAVVAIGPHTALTDSAGRAVLDGVLPGNHILSVEKRPAVLRSEQSISLAEGGSSAYVTLRILKGKMTVIAPVPNARIEIRNIGIFSSPLREYELPAGTYSVAVAAPAYLPFTAEVEILGDKTQVFEPKLLVDRPEMVKFVEANKEYLRSELRGLLERGDDASFRAKAGVILEYGGETLFEFRLLHHHASAFHDARLTITRGGLLYEPQAPCLWKPELLPWTRIARTAIVRQGSTGVLMLVEIAAGKKFERRVPLNFSIFGSYISPESETKPIRAGRVILGQSITTRNRVQSPAVAASALAALAWMIDTALNANRLHALPPPLLTPAPPIRSR